MDANAINLSWLIKLRWGAAIGQILLLIAVTQWLKVEIPIAPLLTLLILGITTNVAALFWSNKAKAISESSIAFLMFLDVFLLSAMLYFTGGPNNPFSPLYLVNIALAAVVLSPSWTWTLVALSAGCYAFLFLRHIPLGGVESHHSMHLHMQGMWLAFGLAALFIVYFVQRIRKELMETRNRIARTERLTSLATLAAGAAHELSTPLATIAVVTKELERQAERSSEKEDLRLIRKEIERCKEILQQMAPQAGQPSGEPMEWVELKKWMEDALAQISEKSQIKLSSMPEQLLLRIPRRALSQAVRNVVRNALYASKDKVRIEFTETTDSFSIRVIDTGSGMSPEVLSHAGEPFFTTKNPGEGMGLGLFLARTVLEGIAGSLEIHSSPNQGTTVDLKIPRALTKKMEQANAA